NNRLFFNIGDIESGVYEAAAGKYSFQVYAGARYAYMSSNTNAFGTAAAGGVTTQAIANFFHSFNGGGPTLFAQGYRQIGGSAFAWFGNARGALLVGSGHQQYNTTLTTARGAVVLTNTPFAFNNITTATLPMAEIETGLEYRIPCRNKMVFARVAAVDMTFFNFGGPFDTTSNLSLLGGRASIGCNY
ncbi:MAG TPA: Lpg1974 family pore-forming outer membrane protein, partial [Pirellulales bacterium]|nr:Lpg1974 family pore-forming outer membrane protein [Pirellulales bacterium]